jgi:two-component system OmpR family sensor kinase
MFSSLRARLWLSYALLIMTALGILAVILIIYLIRNPLANRQLALRLRAIGDIVLASQSWSTLDATALQSGVEHAAHTFGVRVIVYGAQQRPLADSLVDGSPIKFSRLTRLRTTALARDALGQVWIYTLYRLDNGYWLVLASPRSSVPVLSILRDDFFMPLVYAGCAALVFSLVLAFVMARWVADPLQRMITAARVLPQRELRSLSTAGPREIQDLVRAFNDMVNRLQAGQRAQRDFVANVSHELKTPLTSIQGFAQAILDGAAESPDAQRQAATVIYNEAGRMHRMVVDLLDLARLDAGIADLKRTQVDVVSLLKGISEKLMPQARHGEVMLMVEADDLLPIVGDGDRLAQVFTNLVDNALKHTPAGGQVTIRAENLTGGVEVVVEDTGEGITPDVLPHIFERFYQADLSRRGGEGHGAGLGLAIVHEIVHAHGGRITARSTPGQGSAFVVRLPLDSQSAETATRRKKQVST